MPATDAGFYYGVDVTTFHPATADERTALRRQLALPVDAFLILLASRMSHEKDPETVLRRWRQPVRADSTPSS